MIMNLSAILLCVTLFVVIGLLVGLPKHTASSESVWKTFENQTGWSKEIAVLIGIGGPLYGIGPTHWLLNAADEVENPRRSIPIALAIQHIGNILTLFSFYIAVGYGVSDWAAIVSSTYPSPIGAVFQQAVTSKTVTIGLLVVMAVLSEMSMVSSRFTLGRQD
ncbi:choline transport protein [Colletotrichum fioriniae PJ7]|uniref:Choline transport protein n=1 Tax=Colletotrichum fioriniae PJ7 TaxID=1445577 RepID=A0A010QN01_9PEZI|nr:choline transport protein [Colletotrichum fioriniae PJ7]